MIDLRFGLFWSGGSISYLRYMTFVSLRKWHPNASIELYVSNDYSNLNNTWNIEQQDFQLNDIHQKIPLEELKQLEVEVHYVDEFQKYAPNYQSDFFRWWWLEKKGGVYLDTDQIILRSFEDLDLDTDFMYSRYTAPSCGIYTPVGVIGASENSEIVKWINQILHKYYDPYCYNSLGPFMLKSVLKTKKWKDKMYNTKSDLFYPIPDSCYVPSLYEVSSDSEQWMEKIDGAYSLHWFGGHPSSQEFNKSYNEEKSKYSLDLISSILRDKKII